MHARTHAHTHTCTYSRTHACMHTRMHAHTHALTHACTHACKHACMHASMHACTQACTHRHTHTETHTHLCTYKHICWLYTQRHNMEDSKDTIWAWSSSVVKGWSIITIVILHINIEHQQGKVTTHASNFWKSPCLKLIYHLYDIRECQ